MYKGEELVSFDLRRRIKDILRDKKLLELLALRGIEITPTRDNFGDARKEALNKLILTLVNQKQNFSIASKGNNPMKIDECYNFAIREIEAGLDLLSEE